MNKELQDKTWAILPKEVKVYVQSVYSALKKILKEGGSDIQLNEMYLLESIFGEENLTSTISEVDYEQLKQECWEGWLAKHGMKNSIPEDMLTYVFNYALTVPISLDK